jgi:RNA polymerase sigma-70 factor (ECF subfamily)
MSGGKGENVLRITATENTDDLHARRSGKTGAAGMSKFGSSNDTMRDVDPPGVAGVPHDGAAPALLTTLAEADDATLVAAAKDGHGEALEILIQRNQRQALGIALRLTRVREDAEDILQQSLQKAFFKLHQFEGRSSFSTWLTRIVINEALMWQRRKLSASVEPLNDPRMTDEASLLDFPDPGPSPEEICMRREREQILSAAMCELTPGVRAAIELCEFDELSARETAQAMGLSVSAIKSRLFHGRRRLGKLLQGLMKSAWERENGGSRTGGEASFKPPLQLGCSPCD